MSAETLRRAAAMMRDAATHAEALRWWPSDVHDGMNETPWAEVVYDLPGDDQVNRFVESWSPLVALVVADWLDAEAEDDDPCHATSPTDCYVRRCSTHRALAVARAYLGNPA